MLICLDSVRDFCHHQKSHHKYQQIIKKVQQHNVKRKKHISFLLEVFPQ